MIDYIRLKYQNNAKLCHMATGNFIITIKTEDFYDDIADDVKKDLIHQNMENLKYKLLNKCFKDYQ